MNWLQFTSFTITWFIQFSFFSLSFISQYILKVQNWCLCTCICASKYNIASQVYNEQVALELSKFHFVQVEKLLEDANIYGMESSHTPNWVKVPGIFCDLFLYYIVCSFRNLIKKMILYWNFSLCSPEKPVNLITNSHFIQFWVIIWYLFWHVAAIMLYLLHCIFRKQYINGWIGGWVVWLYTMMSGDNGSSLWIHWLIAILFLN